MKKLLQKLPKLLVVAFVALLLVTALAACSKDRPREAATVILLSTNDVHGSVVGNDKGVIGMAKAAEIKASTQNAILIDAGDATQGASFASITTGADVIKAMNVAGYDVMAAGNHDFDYGAATLHQNAELATFPILAANVKKDGNTLLPASTVIERAGYKIGFVGLTTTSTATSTNPTLLEGVTFESELATAKAQIASLKDSTDAIVLICHMGDNSAAVSCTSAQLLDGLTDEERKEVGAIIDGHSHNVEKLTIEGIPVVQTGLNFANIGKVTLNFTDSEQGVAFTASADVIDYETATAFEGTAAGLQKGSEVSAALAEIEEEHKVVLGQSLGTLDHPLFGGYVCYDYVESRVVETAYGDFVTDAFKFYAQKFADNNAYDLPVVAVENGGGISQSLPTWYYNGTAVTVGDVLNAFNHANIVEVIKVSPKDLFAALEKGLMTTGQDGETGKLIIPKKEDGSFSVSGSFLQCSGFSYTYDPAGASGAKVTEVKLADNTVLDRNDAENKILLATNNYVSTFFPNSEKVGELGGEDMIVADYIKQTSVDGVLDYDCAYDRIAIANDASPKTYSATFTVKSGDSAAANQTFTLTIDGKRTEQVVTDADGKFTVTLSKGAHYLQLEGKSNFVYVNNYSGTGVSNVKDGYFTFNFLLTA